MNFNHKSAWPLPAPPAKRWPFAIAHQHDLHKTCLSCGARVPVKPDGTVPDGGLPCGH